MQACSHTIENRALRVALTGSRVGSGGGGGGGMRGGRCQVPSGWGAGATYESIGEGHVY
jgi:hypothetical protein